MGNSETRSPLAAVRAAVEALFADVDPEILDAVRMAASELGENILKYGEPVDGVAGDITISRTADQVAIRTVNRLTDGERARRLADCLGRVQHSEDLGAQFRNRMTEIMREPDQDSTALGLLRVGYEGSFELSSSSTNGLLTLVATRSLR
jgi:hypothetical protein